MHLIETTNVGLNLDYNGPYIKLKFIFGCIYKYPYIHTSNFTRINEQVWS
jgi:hypothetical protein